jgi:hypothetical protein
MADAIKRLNYFDHQFLRAPDFTDEQTYHLSMRRQHNRLLHTSGVAQGLDATAAAGGTVVNIAAGVAIDSSGREMVLPSDVQLDLSAEAVGTTVYLTLDYDEQQSDASTEVGGLGNTRWTEMPKVSFTDTAPAAGSTTLVLGTVARTATGLGPIDTSVRKAAGVVVAGDLSVSSVTLKRDGVDPATWPKLSCSGPSQAVLNSNVGFGSAPPNRNLTVSATGAATGVYANVKNDSQELLIGVDTATVVSAMTASDLQLRTNNTTRVTVQANTGNVGVGLAPARARLEVSGANQTVGLFGDLGISLVANWPCVGFNTYAVGGQWKAISPGFGGVVTVSENDGSMVFYDSQGKAAAADSVVNIRANLTIQPGGRLSSPMFAATQVFNQRQGPLPISAVFNQGGGTLLIIVSGSGFATSGMNIGVFITINGASIGNARSFTNEPNSHKAFTTQVIVVKNFAPGALTLGITPIAGTVTDFNDWFNATVLELPI